MNKKEKETTGSLMLEARRRRMVIPGFNIPYLPMMEPVVRALRDTRTIGLIAVARLEWVKFQSGSLKAIRDEYERVKDERFTRLHLDHVPVIDEDNLRVDYESIIREAIVLGYDSVMVDGSRLSLDENIACTRRVAELAHNAGIAIEAELGAVMGHEAGPLPPYDELFASGMGFTDPQEAIRFVKESTADWLSVAIGNIHGAISAARSEKKIEARLSIPRLNELNRVLNIPLVLHGGSGIGKSSLKEAFNNGIAKINIGMAIRQPYEKWMDVSVSKAQQAVYDQTTVIIQDELGMAGSAEKISF
jgi:ketose-bisphosphate aldolase